MTETKGTFLLGVGAQKAGTTWLHAYLDSRSGCDLGHIKEHHVWDGPTVPEMFIFDLRERRLPLRGRIRSLAMQMLYNKPNNSVVRQAMQRDPERYFTHFERHLAREGIRLTGDITPSYSGLGMPTLTRIRKGFARRGIRTKAVFLMRDALDRAWSAIRMYFGTGPGSAGARRFREGVDMTREPHAALLPYLDTADWRLRGDYPAILARLEAAFPPDDLYIGFYETMFTETEFARLNAFRGTEPDPTLQARIVNGSGMSAPLSAEIRAGALERLRPVYDIILGRWPGMRAHWSAARQEPTS